MGSESSLGLPNGIISKGGCIWGFATHQPEKEILEYSPPNLETDLLQGVEIHSLLALCGRLQIILKRQEVPPIWGDFQALVIVTRLHVLKLKVEHRELGE